MERLNFLTDFNYYFSARPTDIGVKYLAILLIGFGIMLVVASYYKISYGVYRGHLPYYRELSNRVSNWLFTIALLGLLYVFFRYEKAAFLSARVLLLVLLVTFVWWGYYVWGFYISEFKQMKNQFANNKDKKKYWPKKRKK